MSVLDSLYMYLSTNSRITPDHYIQLESDHKSSAMQSNFVAKDGGVISIFDIKGALQYLSDGDYSALTATLEKVARPFISKDGIYIEFVYESDPASSRAYCNKHYSMVNNTLKKVGINKSRLLDVGSKFMQDILIPEKCQMVVHTSPKLLSKSKLQASNEARGKASELIRGGVYSQNPGMLYGTLVNTHNSLCKGLLSKLSKFMSVTPIEPSVFLRGLKEMIARAPSKWEPRMASKGTTISVSDRTGVENDLSSFLSPSFGSQLFSADIERSSEDKTIVRYGSKHYAPIHFENAPMNFESFNELVYEAAELPFRINFRLSLGNNTALKIIRSQDNKALFAKLINEEAKSIHKATTSLIKYSSSKKTLTTMQVSACTWGDSLVEAQRKKEELTALIEGWGSTSVSSERMDSEGAFLGTLPACSDHSIEPKLPLKMTSALKLFPLNRPGNPYSHGSLLLRTKDSRPYPVELFSSVQASWSLLISGLSGHGKSVIIKMLLDAITQMPGNPMLPRGGVVDIGYSASLWVKSLKEFGNEQVAESVEARRLQNSEDECINFFDTPIGLEQPLPIHRSVVIDILSLLFSNDDNKLPDGLSDFIPLLVDELYTFKFKKEPNQYYRGYPVVDEALEQMGWTPPDHEVSWVEMTDILFSNDYIKAAEFAHQQSMPLMVDIIGLIEGSETLKTDYEKAVIGYGQPLLDYVKRKVKDCLSSFKNITKHTNINTNARIKVFDLQDVCPEAMTERQARINTFYFMLSNHLISSEFFMDEESLRFIRSDKYRNYHTEILKVNKACKSFMFTDEWHRTNGLPYPVRMYKRFQRESRKYEMLVGAASQAVTDFDEDMLKMATTLIMLTATSDDEVEYASKHGEVDHATLSEARLSFFSKPDKDGSRLLLRTLANGQPFSQLLYCTAPPYEIWDCTTTKVDNELISEVSKMLDSREKALLALSTLFGTSAKSYIDNKKLEFDSKNLPSSNSDVYKHICSKIFEDIELQKILS